MGVAGLYPYVCKTCRKRFFAGRGGLTLTIILALICLVLAAGLAGGGWWLFKGAKHLVSRPKTAPIAVQNKVAPASLKLREQIDALADSLVEVRREKAALQSELLALRRQLTVSVPSPPPPQAPAAAPPEPVSPNPLKVLLGRISFAPGSAKVSAESSQLLKTIAQRLEQTDTGKVMVKGHFDSTPMGARTAAKYFDNTGLALARALSVFRALRALGVDQARLIVAASGAQAAELDLGRTASIWLLPANRPESFSPKPAKVLLDRIPFAAGSLAINANSGELLKTIARRLEQYNLEQVLIHGNADSSLVGARTASLGFDNAGMAMARAMGVFRALIALGVDQQRLTATVSGAPARDEKALGTVGIWLLSPAAAPVAASPPAK